MLARGLILISRIAGLIAPASAQERVSVATERLASNGALFLAAIQGYFKAEGLDVDIMDYRGPRPVVEAVAAGTVDFGLTALTPGGVQSRRPRRDQGDRGVATLPVNIRNHSAATRRRWAANGAFRCSVA